MHYVNEQKTKAATTPLSVSPKIPEGQVRTFGPVGPKYQVGKLIRTTNDGDWLVAVKVLESGETVEYRLSDVYDDPVAQ